MSPANRVHPGADVIEDGRVDVVKEEHQLDVGEIHMWKRWTVRILLYLFSFVALSPLSLEITLSQMGNGSKNISKDRLV